MFRFPNARPGRRSRLTMIRSRWRLGRPGDRIDHDSPVALRHRLSTALLLAAYGRAGGARRRTATARCMPWRRLSSITRWSMVTYVACTPDDSAVSLARPKRHGLPRTGTSVPGPTTPCASSRESTPAVISRLPGRRSVLRRRTCGTGASRSSRRISGGRASWTCSPAPGPSASKLCRAVRATSTSSRTGPRRCTRSRRTWPSFGRRNAAASSRRTHSRGSRSSPPVRTGSASWTPLRLRQARSRAGALAGVPFADVLVVEHDKEHRVGGKGRRYDFPGPTRVTILKA